MYTVNRKILAIEFLNGISLLMQFLSLFAKITGNSKDLSKHLINQQFRNNNVIILFQK